MKPLKPMMFYRGCDPNIFPFLYNESPNKILKDLYTYCLSDDGLVSRALRMVT